MNTATVFEVCWQNGRQRKEHETESKAKDMARRLVKKGEQPVVLRFEGEEEIGAGWYAVDGKLVTIPDDSLEEIVTGLEEIEQPVAPAKKSNALKAQEAIASAPDTRAPKKAGGKKGKLPRVDVSGFDLRSGSNKANLVTLLASRAGEDVPLTEAVTTVYGPNADPVKEIGKVVAISVGVKMQIAKYNLPFELKVGGGKNGTIGLHPVSE